MVPVLCIYANDYQRKAKISLPYLPVYQWRGWGEREGRVLLVNVGFWTNGPPTPLLKQSSSLKLSFALDYCLMTKNVASFGASTFLTVTCTREQQSHATVYDEEAHCRHRRLIIVTFDLCQSCSSQAHYPAASFDLCIC
ncbi:hypothetical protein T07_10984 [Trichinella nelsoni]|uniref:Uncharacterized protein n=1 Tax=Trichinella nelsoni TaxID=6336 RepID=A0A0V0S4L6_9BILA|nr:hypothetical protein T07_10984 [Trichinella nelsoni]